MTHPVKGGGKKCRAFSACGLERNEQQSEKAAETIQTCLLTDAATSLFHNSLCP